MVTGCCVVWKGVCVCLLRQRGSGHRGPGIEACVEWRKKAHRRPLAALLGVCWLGGDRRSVPHHTNTAATRSRREGQPTATAVAVRSTQPKGSNEEISINQASTGVALRLGVILPCVPPLPSTNGFQGEAFALARRRRFGLGTRSLKLHPRPTVVVQSFGARRQNDAEATFFIIFKPSARSSSISRSHFFHTTRSSDFVSTPHITALRSTHGRRLFRLRNGRTGPLLPFRPSLTPHKPHTSRYINPIPQHTNAKRQTVARSLAEASRLGKRVRALELRASPDLRCVNLMCEKVSKQGRGRRRGVWGVAWRWIGWVAMTFMKRAAGMDWVGLGLVCIHVELLAWKNWLIDWVDNETSYITYHRTPTQPPPPRHKPKPRWAGPASAASRACWR